MHNLRNLVAGDSADLRHFNNNEALNAVQTLTSGQFPRGITVYTSNQNPIGSQVFSQIMPHPNCPQQFTMEMRGGDEAITLPPPRSRL